MIGFPKGDEGPIRMGGSARAPGLSHLPPSLLVLLLYYYCLFLGAALRIRTVLATVLDTEQLPLQELEGHWRSGAVDNTNRDKKRRSVRENGGRRTFAIRD